MKIDYPKPLGVSFVGWSVSISNMLLFVSYYYILLTQQTPAPTRFIDFISMAALFPKDFFHRYMAEAWLVHLFWMFAITICSFGILLFNAFARKVFIVMSVMHGVVLGYIFLMRRGDAGFLDYFFKLYFNYTFIFSYVGFITIPEVRNCFKSSWRSWRILSWLNKRTSAGKEGKDARQYYNLALAYKRLRRDGDMIAALEKAIRIDPDDERCHYELGLVQFRQNDLASARQAFRETIRINPDHFDATFRLAQLYQMEGSSGEAIVLFTKSSRLQPKNSEVYRQLGKAYIHNEDFSSAIAALRRSLEINAQDPETHYQMGWILLNKIGDPPAAREALRAAVRLKPNMIDGNLQLGLACLKMRRYKDAVRAFKDTIQMDASHRQAQYQLGFSYVMLNDLDSARRQLQILRELDSDLCNRLALLISAGVKENVG